MPYCPRCGVETDPSVRDCPLCSTPLPRFEDLGPGRPAWPSPGFTHPADPSKTWPSSQALRSRIFVVLATVIGVAGLTVTLIDLLIVGRLSWSLWPLASLAEVLVLVASVLTWPRRGLRWGLAWMVTTTAYLAVLDLIPDGRLGWAPSLGVPLVVLWFLLIVVGVVSVRRARRLGYNLFALVPALVGVGLVAVDALVSIWNTGTPAMGWSWVTSLVLGPIALLFVLLHYAFRRTPDLDRIFHF